MADHKVPSTATEEGLMGLPVGFRFHPTDEEIVVHYLLPKAMNSNFSTVVIGQADFNKCEPWELPSKDSSPFSLHLKSQCTISLSIYAGIANMGDSERFYYYQRDRKYPTGLRTNRATGAGYWKATGKDKEIYKLMELVGMKKTLVFYTGRAPRGVKTNWVMHEYRLHPQQFTLIPKNDEWVVSRVFNKNASDGMHNRPYSGNGSFSAFQRSDSFCIDELIKDDFESLPPLVDPSAPPKVTHVQDLKPEAVMPISHGFSHMWHPNSSIESYNDDQLIYTHNHNPVDFYPYTFFQSPDIQLKYKKNGGGCTMEEYKCNKVVQQCASSKDKELSFNNFEMLSNDQDEDHDLRQSTLGSMPDLSNLWDY